MFYDSRKFYFLDFSDFGLTFHRAASINHVVDFSTISTDMVFWLSPLKTMWIFEESSPCDSNFSQILAHF